MTNAKTAVLGTFPSPFQADSAADALVLAHFAHGNISVLAPNGDVLVDDLESPPMRVAASGGGLVGTLLGLGIPEYEAKRYQSRVLDGYVLLSVQCDTTDDVLRATEVLTWTGAKDVAFANDENCRSRAIG
jgi:hypothetical protein